MSWRRRGAPSMRGSDCVRCGATAGGRRSSAVAFCQECGGQVCERHCRWHGEGFICTVCARDAGLDVELMA